MIDDHQKKSADVTVAALPVKIEEAFQFGVMAVDSDWRIIGFDEKPKKPKSIPGEPNLALVSMGNYLFNNEVLVDALTADAEKPSSAHDFGHDILPELIKSGRVFAYDFRKNRVPIPSKGEEPSYWRDLGTIDAYFDASMDLCSIDPSFNLYNRSWPLRTVGYADPPAKFVFDWKDRQGMAVNSIVAEGTIISGSYVHNCVVGRNVRIHSFSAIEEAIIMDWVEIGRNCKIRRAIIDKANVIPSGTEIGYDLEKDRQLYTVTPSGIVVIPRGPRKTTWVMANP
jgi:glucose-1-phosphate adenylyltransferase